MKLSFTVLGLFCTFSLLAQEAPLFPSPAYFRNAFAKPTGHVELQPPVKLEDYSVTGKLELSLRSYLDLVMANNTDIAVQKISVETSRNAIMSAFGVFDPTLRIASRYNHSAVPAATQLDGANVNKQTSMGPLQFNYNQTLENSMQFNVGFSGAKTSTNSAFSTFNPAFSSNFSAGFTQPLLRNRGSFITRLPITIARANLRSAELNIRSQILSLVQQAENAYWDVVGARETLRVNEEALKMRVESLNRSQRELELGAIPPLDIYQPQADRASAEIQVSQARYRLAQLEDALRRQIGADLDPRFRTMPIVLTETVLPPGDTTVLDREVLIQKALASRPDLQSSQVGLETDDLSIRSAANLLRPNLNLTGNYQSNGRGGTQFLKTGLGESAVTSVIPGGLYNALSEVFGFNNTTYTVSLTMDFPVRDRAGSARLADAMVRKKLDTLRLRTTEQGIRLDVLNAVTQLESSRESVKLAIVSRDLAQKQLDAEWQKYNLGTSQMFYVLDAQTRLTTAESRVVSESINYRRNQLGLLRSVGTLLEERGITVQ